MAFLASAAGATALLSLLLLGYVLSTPDPARVRALSAWSSISNSIAPAGSDSIQRNWDEPICQLTANQARVDADEHTLARLLASCAPGSGAWLEAVPCAALGLNLDDNAIRIAVGLRLGLPIVLPHQCRCGADVNKLGNHGLACKLSAGRQLRHSLINDAILRALQSAGVPSIREPRDLSRTDKKRPDGATLVPWSRGRCLLWDATTPDTLAPSHIQRSALQAGSAALAAESSKRSKYSILAVVHDFVPIAIETLGAWGPEGWSFSGDLGRRISQVTGDPRATAFLRQRLSLAVQRGNAASVLGTMNADTDMIN